MRIVSLLPSATETLCAIGGQHLLVGRSHECDHPADLAHLPVLTGQKTEFTTSAQVNAEVSQSLASGESLYHLHVARLRELKPNLILTQDLCDVCSIDPATVRGVAMGMDPRPTVIASGPDTFEGVLEDALRIGEACGLGQQAKDTVSAWRTRFFHASEFTNPYTEPPKVLFMEWTDPVYVAGHWTVQLIERAGGAHPLNPTEPLPGAGAGAGGHMAHRKAGHSFAVTVEQMVEMQPDAVVICPCGLHLEQAEREAQKLLEQAWFRALPGVRGNKVAIVDGNQYFNRPGPRLLDAYEWLTGWLNDRSELIPAGFGWKQA